MEKELIPHTRGFVATTDGRIFGPDGVERNYYRNSDGYITASVLTTDDIWVTFGVQRLVALTHKPPQTDPSLLTVNHLDLDVTNNHIDNLEWVSVALNNSHAALMNPSGLRPTIRVKTPTGSWLLLADLETASEVIGCGPLEVWDGIRDRRPINGFEIYHQKSKDPIPEELLRKRIPNRDQCGRAPIKAVKVKNVDTEEVLHFASMASCAGYFNTTPSLVHQMRSREGHCRLMFKQWIVVGAGEEFPSFSQEEIQKARDHGPKEVLAYHCVNNQLMIFGSASEFIRLNKLSKKSITVALKQEKLREIDGWYFTYLTSDNVQVLKDMVK